MKHVIYNVTVSLDHTIENEWVDWMRNKHIPDVMETGCFLESRMSKMNDEETGACTYAMTYVAYSFEDLEKYKSEHAPRLQADANTTFQGKFAAFRTTLNVIEHFKHERKS